MIKARAEDGMLRVHLVPALFRKRLDAISMEDVQRLKVALNGTAIKTINNILSPLTSTPCRAASSC